ncbi:hypothetical protein I4U23_005597 [Adineta vaga]|nr:hypothetical protein I4U23_005597 [Adineta vaga]
MFRRIRTRVSDAPKRFLSPNAVGRVLQTRANALASGNGQKRDIEIKRVCVLMLHGQDVSIFRWGKESEKGTLFYKLCPSCHFFREVNIYIQVPTGTDFQSLLLQIQPDVKKMFAQKWAHGHQKATRRVCRVKSLTIPCEDDSLPFVKVGCSATPAFKSKTCEAHKTGNDNDDVHPVSHKDCKRKQHNLRNNKNCRPVVFALRCKTLKSLQYKKILHRTSGIIAAVYNCGFICSVSELFGSESIKQVYNFLVYMMKNCEHIPDVLIYDDACHLKRFVQNKNNFSEETPANQRISRLEIFCDKLHYRNHTDPWVAF